MPRAAHLCEPWLSELSSVDAALYLPPLGGHGDAARRTAARLGPRDKAARLSDAARRPAADPASDRCADVSKLRSCVGWAKARLRAVPTIFAADAGWWARFA